MYIFEALSYFDNLFSLSVLLCLMLGVMIGLIIGAIPGLSPPMAIALLIPVSFNFPPTEALIMMVSCYAAGMYGGSFSAILIRAPGTSASAASAIEGYELTKKGKAILFDTNGLHAVVPEKTGKRSIRLIYNFLETEQVKNISKEKENIHLRTMSAYENLFKEHV